MLMALNIWKSSFRVWPDFRQSPINPRVHWHSTKKQEYLKQDHSSRRGMLSARVLFSDYWVLNGAIHSNWQLTMLIAGKEVLPKTKLFFLCLLPYRWCSACFQPVNCPRYVSVPAQMILVRGCCASSLLSQASLSSSGGKFTFRLKARTWWALLPQGTSRCSTGLTKILQLALGNQFLHIISEVRQNMDWDKACALYKIITASILANFPHCW